MDLESAAAKHTEWKIKFRMAIANKESMDAATIGKDNCCELGLWMHGAGLRTCGQIPEFSDAVAKHKAFHVEAGKIANLINTKKYAEAEAGLNGSAYSNASTSVVTALRALRQKAK